jgi:hypothetical protein
MGMLTGIVYSDIMPIHLVPLCDTMLKQSVVAQKERRENYKTNIRR